MGIQLVVTKPADEEVDEILADSYTMEAEQEETIEDVIALTEYTVGGFYRITDYMPDAPMFLTQDGQCVEITGSFNLFDLQDEAMDSIQLLEWSKDMAHEETCYRHVLIQGTDHSGNVYDSIELEKAFVVSCTESFSDEDSVIHYSIILRDFDDRVKLEGWSELEDEIDEGGAL